MRIARLAVLIVLAAGCQPAHSAAPGAASAPDSIVLERGPCFGSCPTYRLTLARSGAVRFVSSSRGDVGREERGSVTPAQYQWLVSEAERIGFDRLPDNIRESRYCERMATDHPSADVSIFRGATVKTVRDYLGCHDGPPELRALESAIDSVAGSSRWVRPSAIGKP
jgi:hypothetical protein